MLLSVKTERAFSLSDNCYFQNISVLFCPDDAEKLICVALKEPISLDDLANAFVALATSINHQSHKRPTARA